jgi:hypothetical protein
MKLDEALRGNDRIRNSVRATLDAGTVYIVAGYHGGRESRSDDPGDKLYPVGAERPYGMAWHGEIVAPGDHRTYYQLEQDDLIREMEMDGIDVTALDWDIWA